MKFFSGVLIFLLVLMTACTPAGNMPLVEDSPAAETPIVVSEPLETAALPATIEPKTATPTEPRQPTGTATIIPETESAPPLRNPQDWQNWPVVPTATDTAREIYQSGITLGKNPQAFIKIGDCETYSTWFLADFETENYSLGEEYQSLSGVIDYFQGSYSRLSLAAKAGFNAASVLSPFWADRQVCQPEETPLSCENRIMNPSFALVTLGSNDVWQPDKFEANYRAILDALIAEGVVPVLATKADNIEGDHSINLKIAELAVEYDLPVWNFWAAVQDLPDGGLQEDGVHLTWAPNRFDDPQIMESAWPVRNLTALMVLDSIWRGVTE